MKLLQTALLLILTLIILPIIALRFDSPLSTLQWTMIRNTSTLALCVTFLCFVLSELSGNYSQVDKIWSITPVLYSWQIAFLSDWNERIVLMAFLVTIWGVRLTYNFSRKGAYHWKFWSGEEDYRWAVLRQNNLFKEKPWNWRLFNFFFISLYQNFLIWLITLPAVLASEDATNPLGTTDYIIGAMMLLFIVLETIADQQQWIFQQKKHALKNAKQTLTHNYGKGFIDQGLWGLVRHPNYTSEQMIWILFYCFSIAATGRYLNWSMAGSILLVLLFQGSADFSESISAEKYPHYKDYQKRVGKFIPRLFK